MRVMMFLQAYLSSSVPQFLSFSLTLHFCLYLEVYYIYNIYYIYNNI